MEGTSEKRKVLMQDNGTMVITIPQITKNDVSLALYLANHSFDFEIDKEAQAIIDEVLLGKANFTQLYELAKADPILAPEIEPSFLKKYIEEEKANSYSDVDDEPTKMLIDFYRIANEFADKGIDSATHLDINKAIDAIIADKGLKNKGTLLLRLASAEGVNPKKLSDFFLYDSDGHLYFAIKYFREYGNVDEEGLFNAVIKDGDMEWRFYAAVLIKDKTKESTLYKLLSLRFKWLMYRAIIRSKDKQRIADAKDYIPWGMRAFTRVKYGFELVSKALDKF